MQACMTGRAPTVSSVGIQTFAQRQTQSLQHVLCDIYKIVTALHQRVDKDHDLHSMQETL